MRRSKSILFVDDEEDILEILVDLFSEEGYMLHTAKKATEAMDIVNEKKVDFILSDLKLPDATGFELLDHVKEKNPKTIRVLTSGYLDIKFGRIAVNEKDGTLYLSKPWDLTALKRLVAERLG